MTGPVLICFDGSELAAGAIRGAAELLRPRDALILSVAVPAKDEFPFSPVGDLVGKLTKLYAEMDEYGEQLAADQARNGAEIANQSGLSARPLTASGKAAHTIVRVAEEEDVALIVMGDQRHGPLGGLVGSVSSRVVREAARPVLIIPGPEPNSRVPKPSA